MIEWEDNTPPGAFILQELDSSMNVSKLSFATYVAEMSGLVPNDDESARIFSVGWMSAILVAGVVMHQNGAKIDPRALHILRDLSTAGETFNEAIPAELLPRMAALGASLRSYAHMKNLSEIANPLIDTRIDEVRDAQQNGAD